MDRPPVLDLSCPPRTGMLRFIRRIVSAVSREAGFPDDATAQIELAVDEACTNVIEHAYGDRSDAGHTLHLTIGLGAEHMTIRVVDSGDGLPEDRLSGVRSIEEYVDRSPPRGLGSYIIEQFMDEVQCDTSRGQGTVLSMVKYFESQSPHAGGYGP
jgi:serine/threonine-protein kinase RsbW